MTATPKSTNQASNLEYFGEPIFTYSLKQGIDDGFLAPYNVNRIVLDSDVFGFRPFDKQQDKYGNEIEDKEYTSKDYDRKLVLEKRTKVVAKKISDILKKNNRRFEKSIFFCVDIEHAERMSSALRNENADLFSANSKYVMRITGDNKIGKDQLDSFIDPESDYPVLVTTSKLMTTGVDAQTCKNIIIDANINSIIEFKQIIGRGTRINEQYDKYYFNIYDFRGVTSLFSDPSFDGEPINESADNDEVKKVDFDKETETEFEVHNKVIKYYIDEVEVTIIGEKISRYDEEGKLVTESINEHNERIVKNIFNSKYEFWDSFENSNNINSFKSLLIDKGFLLEEAQSKYGEQNDIITIMSHVAYGSKISQKEELALNIVIQDFNDDFKNGFVSILMDIYLSSSVFDISNMEVLRMPVFKKIGTPLQIVREFRGKYNYEKFVQRIIKELYKEHLNELR
jgi:type I restriction enzyme R subunit